MSNNGGWIGVDLDGTLAEYDGYIHHTNIGRPVARMVDRVKQWLADGQEVRVFTARVYYPEGNEKRKQEAQEAREAISKWCEEHIGLPLKVTCMKDYNMIQVWDDRCVQVQPNTGRIVTNEEFTSYGKS